MSDAAQVRSRFREAFGRDPSVVIRSPGRINLIGEHTDYNGGLVLPGAIDKSVYFAAAPNAAKKGSILSVDFAETETFEAGHVVKSKKPWANYVLGVLDQLEKCRVPYAGFDVAFGGEIPIGAGLGSSAAVEAGMLFTANELFSFGLKTFDMVNMAQKAEHDFAGVRCGIMDQFANLFGKKEHLVLLDCRSMDHWLIPFRAKNIRLVLCDTKVKHALASSEYNTRRAQCEAGAALLGCTIRDVTSALLADKRSALDPTVYKRCQHVVSENERVRDACKALEWNDFQTVGRLMYESHKDLRDLYEVSCPELDTLVEIASKHSGVLGARMMGGGFGGCTINLVEEEALGSFIDAVGNRAAAVYPVAIEDGTRRVG